jgi:antitoxin VapB
METAKIFMNGRSQAVRLPRQYRFAGSQVLVKRVGEGVLLLPFQEPWETLVSSLEMFSDDFMVTRHQPGQAEREALFE